MGELKAFLDDLVAKYNQPDFIPNDPISIPRRYNKPQDIEITGFVAAMLACGQRKTIINKCKKIKSLWKKLRIPIGDRKYFSGAFMVAKSEINEKFVDEHS